MVHVGVISLDGTMTFERSQHVSLVVEPAGSMNSVCRSCGARYSLVEPVTPAVLVETVGVVDLLGVDTLDMTMAAPLGVFLRSAAELDHCVITTYQRTTRPLP